ncbi:MAG: hypothetical protein ACFFDK_02325 [Promethearchaeota archaeon]
MSEKKNQDLEDLQIQKPEDSPTELTKKQVILYSAIIAITITICIIAMIGINLFALLIIIGVVLVYVYFDNDIRKGDSTDILNNNTENEKS